MSIPGPETEESRRVIDDRRQLVAYLEAGCKPEADWRIGTEHEKFPFLSDTLEPVPYEGERSIRAMLEGLAQRFGWQPVREAGNIIGLTSPAGGNISLEPGGQFELSGAPLGDVHETCLEVHEHLRQVREVGDRLGIGFLGLGFSPLWRLEDTPIMPKGRYKIMRAYMAKKGKLGRDMMFRSCTVQVNLDFASEADMVAKLRVALALQPVATALFANSPFTEGRLNGYLSYRSHIWTDTDPDRTGMAPFAFEDGFGFERWVDYALDVPMYFIYRDGVYHDVSGLSFRDFLAGRLAGFEGQLPTIQDWSDHLTTIFPEVRIKQYMEMRGADAGPWRTLCALPALWVGLLYDASALAAAWDVVKAWTAAERQKLRDDVPRLGLRAEIGGRSVKDIAGEVLAIAGDGLKRRGRPGCHGRGEEHLLEVLMTIAETGVTQAEELIGLYKGPWRGDVSRVFRDFAF